MAEGDPKTEMDKQYFDYAWKLFEKHAQQRIQCFNFFVIMFLAILAALITAMAENNWLIGILIAIVLGYVTHVFYLLEDRSRKLIEFSEAPLLRFEARFVAAGYSEANIIGRGNESSATDGISYHVAFSRFTKFAYLISALGIIFCGYMLIRIL